ncbi:MAG: hypothetical protein GF401_15780 [Chitinivibrionales bacterium]|nr:hypothetical protein [Chitinivibrionales bacterium]
MNTQTLMFRFSALLFLTGISSHLQGSEVVSLTPQPDEFVLFEDFFVSFAYSGLSGPVSRVKLFFDKQDISSKARITGSTVTFIPGEDFMNRPDLAGPHIVTVILYGSHRKQLADASVRFYLTQEETVSDEKRKEMKQKGRELKAVTPQKIVHTGRINSELGYRNFHDSTHSAAILEASGNGYRGKQFYNYNLSLTTDEDKHRQTLQRFRIGAGHSHMLRLSIGDNFPAYNTFILRDQRVRGLEVNMESSDRRFGIDVVFGNTQRAIAPYVVDNKALATAEIMYDTAENFIDTVNAFNRKVSGYADGTFKRSLFAARFQVGTEKRFRIGLDILKAKDNPKSIDQISLLAPNISLDSSGADTSLADTVFKKQIRGVTPKDNIAGGLDARLSLWKRRITLFSDFAFSFLTNDISNGPSSNDEISDALGEDASLPIWPNDIKGVIIINETSTPLPIPVDSTETINAGALGNSIIWDAGLKLHMPIGSVDEEFEFTYLYAGTNYRSLGNENQQNDKAGIIISNGVRVFDRRVYVRGGLSWYRNDLAGLKSAPAHMLGFNLMGTLFWSPSLPIVTITLMSNSEEVNSSVAADSRDNRFGIIGASIQYSRKFGITDNTVTFSVNNSRSRLEFGALLDDIALDVNTGILALTTRYDDYPFDTRLSATVNTSKGDYGLTLVSPSAGITRHFIPDEMRADLDLTFEHYNDRNADPVNEIAFQSSWAWEITTHHSLFARGEISTMISEALWDNQVSLAYEFRF